MTVMQGFKQNGNCSSRFLGAYGDDGVSGDGMFRSSLILIGPAMRYCFSMLIVFCGMAGTSALAGDQYKYDYLGLPYTYAGNNDPSNSPIGPENRIHFSFINDGLIQSGVNIQSWTLSDGTRSVDNVSMPPYTSIGITPSATLFIDPIDYWYITVDYANMLPYPIIFQTRKEIGRAMDWSQNEHANYGGNWDSPGIWTVAAVSPVPEPETYAMMLAGLGLLGVMARRRKLKLNA